MFKHYILIFIELLFTIIWVEAPLPEKLSYKDKLILKRKWDDCCVKNLCVYNSCFFALRRPSTWAAIRQRCQSRYPDYPLFIDLTQIRNEDELEILSNMMLKETNIESPEQIKVWTSGINCSVSMSKKSSNYLAKWTNSDSSLPKWLYDKITYTYDKSDEGGCQFLTYTPAKNISEVEFEFQDQTAHHLGVCEFMIPEDVATIILPDVVTSKITYASTEKSTLETIDENSTNKTILSTSPKTKSKTLNPFLTEATKDSPITLTTPVSTSTSSFTVTDSNMFCKGKRVAGIDWPDTAPGATANESCPEGMIGYAQWTCNQETLQFTPEKPHIQGCSHVWIKELEDNVERGGDAVVLSAKLAEETKKQNMSHGDITALVDLSEKIMHLFSSQMEKEDIKEDEEKPKSYRFTNCMVSTMSNILRTEIKKEAWLNLPVKHQTRAASKILLIVSIIGSHLSCIKKSEEKLQFTVSAENIDLQTFIMNEKKQNESDILVFPQKVEGVKFNSSLVVPANLNWRSPCKDYNTAVGVLYKHVGDFLKEENETSVKKKVVTKVISFSMNKDTKEIIKLPPGKVVTITLRHNLEEENENQHLRCMFWNFLKSEHGQWDDSGCWKVKTNKTHIVCSCDHMTNFAVLMDVQNNVKEDDILSVMTYVCCGMSSLSLVITLICFLCIRSLHGRRSIITGNLCVALLFTNLLILFGLDQTGNKTVCATIAAFLHFWILSAFCWMLVEGYHLYKMVVLVFERGRQLSLKFYYLFGYGIPLSIVIISLGIKIDDYGGDTYCWLSSENGLMWSFVGPACTVILINIVVFIMTLRSASSVRIKREQTTLKNIKNLARGSMSVMCLLGLTWCLGLFYIDRKLQIFSYIFTIFNGLQGVFIFLFHILLNEKVHNIMDWSGTSSNCWKKYSQQTSSNQLHSKLSTRTSVNSIGCASCNVSVVNTRRSSNTASQQISNKESINSKRLNIKGKKYWSSENSRLNLNKEKATKTISENGVSNYKPQRRYKTRSQSVPEDCDNAHAYDNICYITRNNNRASGGERTFL